MHRQYHLGGGSGIRIRIRLVVRAAGASYIEDAELTHHYADPPLDGGRQPGPVETDEAVPWRVEYRMTGLSGPPNFLSRG